jgi:hypothetical protein
LAHTTFRTIDVKHPCKPRFEESGEGKWMSICNHVDKIEKLGFELESINITEDRTKSIIIIIHDRISSSSSSNDSESDECQDGILGAEELQDD